ncbi:28757_t:CDS:2, partial [Gigaspora margarita]
EIQAFKNNQQKQQAQIIALLEEIRNLLKDDTSFLNNKPRSLDVGQLEYSITQTLTYGTIIAGLITLATGKLAMSLIGLAVGIFLYKSGVIQKLT